MAMQESAAPSTGAPRRRIYWVGGSKTVTFPDLADRVADDLYTKRLTIAAAARSLPIGNRADGRWRAQVRRALSEVLE